MVYLPQVTEERLPPITETVLTARNIQDEDRLSNLLDLMLDRFVTSHTLRLNLPSQDGNPGSRSFDVDITPGVVEGKY